MAYNNPDKYPDIIVSECRFYPAKESGEYLGSVNMTFNGRLVVKGISLHVNKERRAYWIGMPSRQVPPKHEGEPGEWQDMAFPITREFRDYLIKVALKARERWYKEKQKELDEPDDTGYYMPD